MVNAYTLNCSYTGRNSSTANTTQYWGICGAGISTSAIPSTTESDLQVIFRSTGTASNLWIRIKTNTVNASTLFTFRKNAGAGNQSISVASNATGTFTDSTNTDTIASGDLIALQSIPGSGSTGTFKMTVNAFLFLADSNTVTRMVSFSNVTESSTNTTVYFDLTGSNGFLNTGEQFSKFRQRKAGTYQNAAVNVNTGATTAFTINGRLDGANGNITIPVGSNSTGLFEDTTHSDSVAIGDDYNFSLVTGSSAGMVILTTQIDFVSTNGDTPMIHGNNDNSSIDANTTLSWPMGGYLDNTATTESDSQILANLATTFSELEINIGASTVNAATLTLRQGGADTALTLSATANTTGYFFDSTHTVTVLATDLVDLQFITGGAAGTKVAVAGVWGNNPDVPIIPSITIPIQWEQQIRIPYGLR